MSTPTFSPWNCPVCGAEVPPRAHACPDCGADERTGWDEEATRYDGLDLPNEAFEDENQPAASRKKPGVRVANIPLFWWLMGVAILVITVVGTFWIA